MNRQPRSLSILGRLTLLLLLAVPLLVMPPVAALSAVPLSNQMPAPEPGQALAPAGTGCWSLAANYPETAWGVATTAHDGSLYSFGGSNGAILSNAYRYDPALDAWSAIAPLPTPRSAATATSDGTYIYILGGSDTITGTTTLYRYDPIANNYITLAEAPQAVFAHAAALLNGNLYRIAGNVAGASNTVDVYTIGANTWASGPAYPLSVIYPRAVAWNGYIYTLGGREGALGTAKTYRFDGSTWDDAGMADLPAGAGRWAAGVSFLSGQLIVAGGETPGAAVSTALAWNPTSDSWSSLPNMLQLQAWMDGATLGSTFYTVAGFGENNLNLVQRYMAACHAYLPVVFRNPVQP